jgi:hypothetical protein
LHNSSERDSYFLEQITSKWLPVPLHPHYLHLYSSMNNPSLSFYTEQPIGVSLRQRRNLEMAISQEEMIDIFIYIYLKGRRDRFHTKKSL